MEFGLDPQSPCCTDPTRRCSCGRCPACQSRCQRTRGQSPRRFETGSIPDPSSPHGHATLVAPDSWPTSTRPARCPRSRSRHRRRAAHRQNRPIGATTCPQNQAVSFGSTPRSDSPRRGTVGKSTPRRGSLAASMPLRRPPRPSTPHPRACAAASTRGRPLWRASCSCTARQSPRRPDRGCGRRQCRRRQSPGPTRAGATESRRSSRRPSRTQRPC
mmetsp:Transcript_19479/g.58029  ORF Transcript_19479/g.58029 Transcript_19479/m.58029 type:complete len:216 (-) Transcript_19479:229-876(-)